MGGRERNLCVNLDEKHEIHPSRVSAYHSPVLLSRLGTVPATCGPRRDTASFRWGNQCALQWVSACSLPREVFTLAPGCFPGYIYALTEPIKKKKKYGSSFKPTPAFPKVNFVIYEAAQVWRALSRTCLRPSLLLLRDGGCKVLPFHSPQFACMGMATDSPALNVPPAQTACRARAKFWTLCGKRCRKSGGKVRKTSTCIFCSC